MKPQDGSLVLRKEVYHPIMTYKHDPVNLINKKEIAIFKDCSEKSTYTWLQDSMGDFYSRT
jgi:hypothetical protein